MYDVEFYDSRIGRKMAVNMGRTGELTMTVDEWEKFCGLMLFEISRDREKIRLTTHSTGLATNAAIESSSLAGTVSNGISVTNLPTG